MLNKLNKKRITLEKEQELLRHIKKDDHKAFRQLFDIYYKYLVVTVYNVSGNLDVARDMAQDTFADLWNRRQKIQIESSLKSYLRRTVLNKTFNHFKLKANKYDDLESIHVQANMEAGAQQRLEAQEMEQIIHGAIQALPEKCRLVFTLARLEGLTHKGIATQLGISTKTVENQMTKAMKRLKMALEQFKKTHDFGIKD